MPRWGRVSILVLIHAVFFALAYMAAFVLRFDFAIPESQQEVMWKGLLPMLGIKLAVFAALRMFQGWWKYVSLYDVVALTRALAAASGVWLAVNVLFLTSSVPRSIYILDFGLALFLLGSARGGIRLMRENLVANKAEGPRKPVLIAGAGDTGEALIREITRNRNINYRPVGFLDDDPYKQGLRVHGVRVLGPVDALPRMAEKHDVDEVIIAMPSAGSDAVRNVVDLARRADVTARIVPAFETVVEGRVSVQQIREVAITDLLGREPVELDTNSIGRFLERRRVMVTGAGGSIGSEICRQVLRYNLKSLVMVDCAETPLFLIDRELGEFHDNLHPTIADVADEARMREVFEEFKPEVILHAAAYKHVPLMEAHPSEAVKNNVKGTKIVADLADEYGADSFVLISTDKAVNPTSVMGATKRASELYVRHLGRHSDSTNFCAVRFGNVLGSNGSVIPIFREQIKNGGPVTVTHREMTRYFMTIPEATQLVLQAASFRTGELFILDMGKPVKIMDLARDMIRLSGLTEDDVNIEITGIRPGEKLFEELALDHDKLERTEHEKIFAGDGDAERVSDPLSVLADLLEAAEGGEDDRVRRHLKRLIPTYDVEENGLTKSGKVIALESVS